MTVTRINSGIYDVHVPNGTGGLRYAGRVQKTEGERNWITLLGHKLEYDRDFETKRAAIADLERTAQ